MHALRVERESINTVAGRNVTVYRGTYKPASVWKGWMSHSPGGRQVHPNQTKAVKGQGCKILATTGAIKRPLPCPVKEVEKQRAHFTTLKEKQSKRKRKKDKNENREEKKEKLRKKEES